MDMLHFGCANGIPAVTSKGPEIALASMPSVWDITPHYE
jgi:hypothetical protein